MRMRSTEAAFWVGVAGIVFASCGRCGGTSPAEPTSSAGTGDTPSPAEPPQARAQKAGQAAAKNSKPTELPTQKTLALNGMLPGVDIPLKDTTGQQLTLDTLAKSKGLLVVFTCNHCPWAKAWEERVAAIGRQAQQQGLGVVAVNSNDPSKYPDDNFDGMKKRAAKLELAFPYVMDKGSKLARAFGAERTPEAFLFNAERRLVYHGTIDDNAEEPQKVTSHYLRDAVESLLNGADIEPAETKSVGCGIKFHASKAG